MRFSLPVKKVVKARNICNTISQNLCQEMQPCFSASFLLITSQNFYLFSGCQSCLGRHCRQFCLYSHSCNCNQYRQAAKAVLCFTNKNVSTAKLCPRFCKLFCFLVSIEFNFEKKTFCLVSSFNFNWPGPRFWCILD